MSEQVETVGQCAWCLQRDRQAFALVCPGHVNQFRVLLDDLQRDIRSLCRAVGEFDGARPESPQVVLQICTDKAARLQALVSEQAREIARLNDDLAYEREMTLCVVDAMNEAQDALASLVRVFVSLHGHGESWVSAHRDRPDSDRITFMAELGAIRAAIAVLEARDEK